jgi:branched-chain amino acid transport system substrate-binding protein
MTGRVRQYRLVFAFLVVMALVAVACGDDAQETTTTGASTTTGGQGTTVPTGEPIVFASSLPLTGDFSTSAIKHKDGYQLCVDLINERGGIFGRPVELMVEDNRSDTEVAVTQYERFISSGEVDALLGTFSGLLSFPTSAVAEREQWVYLIPSGTAQRIYERGYQYIFNFQQGTAEQVGFTAVNALLYYRDQGLISAEDFPKSAAVISSDDFFPDAVKVGLLGGTVVIPDTGVEISLAPGPLAEAGIEVVLEETWPLGEFSDWMNLANSIKASGADAVFAGMASLDEVAALLEAFATVDYQPKFIYMSQGAQSELLTTVGADLLNGLTVHTAWHPTADFEGTLGGQPYSVDDFIADFTAVHGRAPDEDEAIPFAVCQGLEQAILGAGSIDQVAMKDWLHARTAADPVRTVLGNFYWDEKGLPIDRNYLLTQWQDGELKLVFPVGEFPGTVDLVYPKPEW